MVARSLTCHVCFLSDILCTSEVDLPTNEGLFVMTVNGLLPFPQAANGLIQVRLLPASFAIAFRKSSSLTACTSHL